MNRIPEPTQLMTSVLQCKSYAEADRHRLRDFFVRALLNTFTLSGSVADLGCGPADYDVRIITAFPEILVDAYDGSAAMVELAKENVKEYSNISVIHAEIEKIDKKYDFIISANALHHFFDPNTFWRSIKSMSTGNTRIFIMDLLRPNSLEMLNKMVDSCVEEFSLSFRNDFEDSLKAAFTEQEIKNQLLDNSLNLSTTVYRENIDLIVIYGVV